jgi:2-methylcitrate dehydratase PrpD
VVLRLNNGDVLDSGAVTVIRGHADDPMSVDELWEKFADCTARTHSPAQARALFDRLQAIDALSSVRDLPSCAAVFAH